MMTNWIPKDLNMWAPNKQGVTTYKEAPLGIGIPSWKLFGWRAVAILIFSVRRGALYVLNPRAPPP